MKTIITFLAILLSIHVTLSQSSSNEDIIISPFWDFYSTNYLSTKSSGKGYTGIASENDISGILLNPASVTFDTKYQMNVQYTFKTRQPWLTSLGLSDLALKQ